MPLNPGMKPQNMINSAGLALDALLPKLEDVLREENNILELQKPCDHETYIKRKNQLLRELMAVQRMEGLDMLPDDMRLRLAQTRALIGINHQYLGAQVAAMSEITNILTAVALAEDADGTYSRRQ